MHGEQIHWRRFLIGHRLIIELAFVASALLFAFWPGSAARAEETGEDWTIECVDCPRYFEDISPGSLQVGGGSDLHVVYGSEHLYHAWTENNGWKSEVVDATLGAGHPAVLAIDQKDELHVVYPTFRTCIWLKFDKIVTIMAKSPKNLQSWRMFLE